LCHGCKEWYGKFCIKKVSLQQCLVKEQYTALENFHITISVLDREREREREYKNGVSVG
jgi:hypothetical protein